MGHVYYKIYKPFGYLSQFTKEFEHHKTLKDLHNFPSEVYPVGRLDKDSEGLLLLTNNKKAIDKILNPKNKILKTYWAQVEGSPCENDLKELRSGVEIKIKPGKYYTTLPCKAEIIREPNLPERNPPIRYRKSIQTTWLELTISEGKNRQVRKMCAKIGYPVLRLVRFSIGKININDLLEKKVKKILDFDRYLP